MSDKSKERLDLKGILFDLDGVFYVGDEAIAGGDRVVEWVREQRIPHLFVTNTTSRPRAALVRKLAGLGIVTDEDHLLTPPRAAAQWLAQHVEGPLALFVPEATRAEFSGFPLWNGDERQRVGAVIVGDLGEGWDYATLNRAFRLLMQEPAPALVALGMTRYWKAPDGLRLDTAPFVVALQHASGVEPVVLGKPARAFFEAGLARLGCEAHQCLMVGDDIRGDVEGARQAGLHAVLVRTGKFRPADLETGIVPDAVLGSIAELPAWWSRHVGSR